MRSVRLDEALEGRLEKASRATGKAASEIIREGVAKRCDEILGSTLYDRIKDVIGSVASTPARRRGSSARRSGKVFAGILRRKYRRRRSRS